MGVLETVKIKSGNQEGYMVINKSDLTKKHTLFVEKEKPAKEKDKKDEK